MDRTAQLTLTQPRSSSACFVRFGKAELEQSIPERFARQVIRHGERLAVKFGHDRLNYRQLDELSNRVARAILGQRGSDPEPVVLLVRQGLPLIAAILGALKAGKFYVPLDPSAPGAELGHQIDHCQPCLLIADGQSEAVAARCAAPSRPVLRLDRIDGSVSAEDPGLSISPDAYAYVYYTSGSTGRAKGVVDSHRNVLHNIMRYTNALGIGADDQLTLLQAPIFSGAVSSLFSAMLNGAAVYPFDLNRQSIGEIARVIIEDRITIWHSVPAIFERLVGTGSTFPSLRLIRLEGDQASRRHIDLFKQAFGPDCVLVNGLGATETGITRQFFVRHGTKVPGNTVPLGYATEDMETLILDETGEEASRGTVGEIAIRSRYLALGYWCDRERTETAFSSLDEAADTRIYRTGDLGRLGDDGCLEYLGRRNFRLKVRGRWVETDVIEAALQSLDLVKDAAVQACQAGHGAVQLVAYVVPVDGATPSTSELRTKLAEQLSADALPSRFVLLDRLPLNDNFKVDRNALPHPDNARPCVGTPFAQPRDPIELALVEIWRDVLGFDRIGIHDRFFELGGDSLQALEIAHLIEQQIEAGFAVSDILEAETIADMAERVRAVRPANCLVPIRPGRAGAPLFCIHDQSGEVLCYRELAEHLDGGRPVYGLRAVDLMAGIVPPVEQIAARYIEAIRQVQPHGPYLLAGNCFGGTIAFEIAQQLVRAEERVPLLLLLDTAFPIGRLREARGRLSRWWWKLSGRPVGAQVSYLGRTLLARVTNRIRATPVRCRGRQSVARRHAAIERAMRAVGQRYQPQPYEGSAMLVRIGRQTNQGGWERLVKELEVIELPVQSGRLDADVVRSPYVDQVAQLLHLALQRWGKDDRLADRSVRQARRPVP